MLEASHLMDGNGLIIGMFNIHKILILMDSNMQMTWQEIIIPLQVH